MLKVEEIVKATKGELLSGNLADEIKDYKIDSREITNGDFYIPIIGEKVDGHKFIYDCIEKGCSGFFVSNVEYIRKISKKVNIIKVADTKQALIDIAKYNRNKHKDIDVVAITGSVGKTSTREMVASVLSEDRNILVTQKNMNSHIGMPLMDLKLEKQDLAVLEAGIDFVGEMDILNELLIPDVAIVTNIGTSHIGKFGSQEVIYKEKTNISNGLKGKKVLLLNGDDEFLSKYTNSEVNVKFYSIKDAKNIYITDNSIEYDTYIYNKVEHIIINAIGNHNILNSLVAIKVAEIYKIPTEKIKSGIFKYKNFNRRMEKINLKEILIIDDTYNASPSSMESGLVSVNSIASKRKIAVLADILELGKYSKSLHSDLGKVFKSLNFDIIVAYGNDMRYLIDSAKEYVKEVYYYSNSQEAEEKIRSIMKKGDVIYFKGSNSMNVNKIVENLKKDFMN